MSHRFFARIAALAAIVALGILTEVPAAGQQAPAPAKKAAAAKPAPSRTPWGDPDLQGVYTFATTTPIERPKALGLKDHYTEEEIAALQKKADDAVQAEGKAPRTGDTGTYNNFWISSDKGRVTGRTSLITDPEDGRMPPFTERVQKIRAQWAAKDAARQVGKPPYVQEFFNSWRTILFTRAVSHGPCRGCSNPTITEFRFCSLRDMWCLTTKACTTFVSSLWMEVRTSMRAFVNITGILAATGRGIRWLST